MNAELVPSLAFIQNRKCAGDSFIYFCRLGPTLLYNHFLYFCTMKYIFVPDLVCYNTI